MLKVPLTVSKQSDHQHTACNKDKPTPLLKAAANSQTKSADTL